MEVQNMYEKNTIVLESTSLRRQNKMELRIDETFSVEFVSKPDTSIENQRADYNEFEKSHND